MSSDTPTYDEALAAELDGDDEANELRERLLAGEANHDDRRDGRERLDDIARRRFDLAHPSEPRETAREIDAGEIELARGELDKKKSAEAILEKITEAVDDGSEGEVVVRMSVRLTASSSQ